MAGLVNIEHKDGRRFAIAAADFDKPRVGAQSQEGDVDQKSYKDLGFKIMGYEDGEPYEPRARASPADKG